MERLVTLLPLPLSPHDAQHLALIQVEADAADGLDLAHVGEKGGLQIPNGK